MAFWRVLHLDEPRSHFILRKTTADTLSSLAQVKTLMPGNFSDVTGSSDFELTEAGGVVTYTGEATKWFMVQAQFASSCSAIRTLLMQVSKDEGSTFVSGADLYAGYAAAGAWLPLVANFPIQLANGESFAFYFSLTSSSGNLTIDDSFITVTELLTVT